MGCRPCAAHLCAPSASAAKKPHVSPKTLSSASIDRVQPRRFARQIHLPGRRLRAARGDPLRRRHLRLSALLSAPVHARTLATAEQGAPDRALRLGTGHTERRGQEAEVYALADVRAAGHEA
jgi:hypothetical protein